MRQYFSGEELWEGVLRGFEMRAEGRIDSSGDEIDMVLRDGVWVREGDEAN